MRAVTIVNTWLPIILFLHTSIAVAAAFEVIDVNDNDGNDGGGDAAIAEGFEFAHEADEGEVIEGRARSRTRAHAAAIAPTVSGVASRGIVLQSDMRQPSSGLIYANATAVGENLFHRDGRDVTLCYRMSMDQLRGTANVIASIVSDSRGFELTTGISPMSRDDVAKLDAESGKPTDGLHSADGSGPHHRPLGEDDAPTDENIHASVTMRLLTCRLWMGRNVCADVIIRDFDFAAWYHVCLTYQLVFKPRTAIRVRHYVNGVRHSPEDTPFNESFDLDTLITDAKSKPVDTTLIVGNRLLEPGSVYSFAGVIVDFGLWSGVLSEAEIVNLYLCNAIAGEQDANEAVMAAKFEADDNAFLNDWTLVGAAFVADMSAWRCSERPNLHRLVAASPVAYDDFKSVCDSLSGKIPVLNSVYELAQHHVSFSASINESTVMEMKSDMLSDASDDNAGGDDSCITIVDNDRIIYNVLLGQKRIRDTRPYIDIDPTDPFGVRRRQILVDPYAHAAAEQNGTLMTDLDYILPLSAAFDELTSVDNFPIFGEDSSCLSLTGENSKLNHKCSVPVSCGICELPSTVTGTTQWLILKGLCQEAVAYYDTEIVDGNRAFFDHQFYVHGSRRRRPHILGLAHSHILFDSTTSTWCLESMIDPGMRLCLRGDFRFPIGTYEWTVDQTVGEETICKRSAGETISLTLSTCYPNMYTCNTGPCIPLSHRCNTEIDCLDKSDEYNCDYLSFGKNYAKELIPRDETGQPVIVYMNVSVLAFPYIETVNLKFTSDFYLNLRWNDIRIDFRDLNNVTSLNSLNERDRESLWIPQLAFINALGPYQTTTDELTSGLLIREDVVPLSEDLTQSTEAMLFSGKTNSILLSREYYQEYSCSFNLRYYPFDTQMCTMIFELQGKTENYVRLEKDGVGIEFLGGRLLVEYEIQMETLDIASVANISRAVVKIVFRRRMVYHVTNTIFQTFVLVLVGYMTLYFHVDNFTDRIMVTLTTMLVEVTFLSSMLENLPKTSYYKLIDWWFFFCVQMLVLTMLAHTYIHYRCNRLKDKHTTYINSIIDGLAFGKQRFMKQDGPRPSPFVDNISLIHAPQVVRHWRQMASTVHPRGKATDGVGKRITDMDGKESPITTPTAAEIDDDRIRDENYRSGGVGNAAVAANALGSGSDAPSVKQIDYSSVEAVNRKAKLTFIGLAVAFNVVFWAISLNEYLIPAEYYVNQDNM